MSKQKTQDSRESKNEKSNKISKPKWIYYTENGSRKRKLKVAAVIGPEAQALYDVHESESADLTSSFHEGSQGCVFEFYREETL